jgi:hypothetical protein
MRRDGRGEFGPIVLQQSLSSDGSDGGRMSLALTPQRDTDGQVRVAFQLDAQRWLAPVGPALPWAEVVATGRVSPGLIAVDSYTLSGFYGVAQGSLYAAQDVQWALTGTSRVSNLDVETVMRSLRARSLGADPIKPRGDDNWRAPMQGVASMSLVVGGRGKTLTEALDLAVTAGPLEVRHALLNGINLGFAATQGIASSGGGGITRFSDLDASIVVSGQRLLLKDISGRAGAMATRGTIAVANDLTLTGSLNVDLGATRVQAPLRVEVAGSVLAPRFGR